MIHTNESWRRSHRYLGKGRYVKFVTDLDTEFQERFGLNKEMKSREALRVAVASCKKAFEESYR